MGGELRIPDWIPARSRRAYLAGLLAGTQAARENPLPRESGLAVVLILDGLPCPSTPSRGPP